MENKNLILFTQYLQKIFGQSGHVKELVSQDLDQSPLYFYVFHNHPATGLMTIVSYGLSEVSHPKWHFGRPELLLCVESKNESWVDSLGGIIHEFRGEKSFSYGSVYETGNFLSQDTACKPTPFFLAVF